MECRLLSLCVETQLGESGQGANLLSMASRPSKPAPDTLPIMNMVMRPLMDPIFISPPLPPSGFTPSFFCSLLSPFHQFRWGMTQALDPSLGKGLDPI